MSTEQEVSVKLSFTEAGVAQVKQQYNEFFEELKVGFNLNIGAKFAEGLTEIPALIQEVSAKASEYAESVVNMATQTRTTTDAMQVLSLLAAQSGVEVGKLTMAVQAMSTGAETAVNGPGKMADAFKDLGINAKDFSALSVPEQLQALGRAGEAAGWSTNALNDLTEILGKKNMPQLLEILKKVSGPEGFQGYADEAVKAGLVVSESTLEANRKIAESVKETDRLASVAYSNMGTGMAMHLNDAKQGWYKFLIQIQQFQDYMESIGASSSAKRGESQDMTPEAYANKYPQTADLGTGHGAAGQSAASAAKDAAAQAKKDAEWQKSMNEDTAEGQKMDAAAAAADLKKSMEWEKGMDEDIAAAKKADQKADEEDTKKLMAWEKSEYEDMDEARGMARKADEEDTKKTMAWEKGMIEDSNEVVTIKKKDQTREQQSATKLADSQESKNHYQSAGSGATGGLEAIASQAQTIGDVINGVIQRIGQAMQSSIATNLTGLINGTEKLGQAFRAVGLAVEQSLVQGFANAVAQQIVTTAASVAIHTGGETAKTGATAAGAAARDGIGLGETIFHGIQTAIKTAVHIAGEIAKTASTVVNTGIRIASIIGESIANVFNAAAGALSAMASIPYVGPILAVAAMAAVLGAGMALVKGIGKKSGGYAGSNGYTPAGDPDEESGEVTHKGEWVAPAWMVEHQGAGGLIRMLEGVRTGAMSMSGLASRVYDGLSIRGSTTRGGSSMNQEQSDGGRGNSRSRDIIVHSEQQAHRAMRSSHGQATIIRAMRNNRDAMFR